MFENLEEGDRYSLGRWKEEGVWTC